MYLSQLPNVFVQIAKRQNSNTIYLVAVLSFCNLDKYIRQLGQIYPILICESICNFAETKYLCGLLFRSIISNFVTFLNSHTVFKGFNNFHVSLQFDFSPLCVLKCVLKWSAREDAKSHWLHLFGFSPLCVFKWVLKWPAREDAKSHWLHFSTVRFQMGLQIARLRRYTIIRISFV